MQDQETTDKKRNPSKAHRPDLDAQVTLGAQYFVEGTIANIEGDHYVVDRDETGERVRLLVNRDTNLDCAAMQDRDTSRSAGQKETITSDRVSPQHLAPEASAIQMEQGQRADETARGAGFRIGRCVFQRGDRVKVEVDDNGKITTMKFLSGALASSSRSVGLSAGTGELAIPGDQDHPAELAMTGQEGFLPKTMRLRPSGRAGLRPPMVIR